MDHKDITLESVEDSRSQRNDSMLLEDRKRERKIKLKLDFIVLPLLATVYFLASMVTLTTLSLSLRVSVDDV